MLKQHALFSLALLSSASLYAIPIESRGLSDSNANNPAMNIPAPITGNMNWDLIQKNQQLESQVRELRGKIEEQDHAIDQLNKELTNRYTDLDQRLELLQQKIDPEEVQPEAATQTPETAQATSEIVATPPRPTTNQQQNTQQSINNKPISTPDDQEKAAYTIALDAYKKGGAKQAIAPMQNFIKNNPNSAYTGNAYFWLAEFNLAIEPPNYTEAKKNYEIVAAKFPNSIKAPRALYQLYSIAKDVNKNMQTANVYKNKLLTTYPKSEEAGYFKKI
ncbi:YbgF trimerization domain-containing protein [Acinetobacter sp. ANC 4648]|uniref:YbgF trimerization domain-containing protein n=1 Tax=Acinetobacter sp. ANC 4648 TaxID=1977875 RepID=UPI000A349AED|nr:YbgF trimerization domain-containing protein [Acinetobacter sp. ANC 4648]OTG82213.1 hypothetical protein B9T27_08145 [Acinetobacter sp. ANC 4648]